MTLILNNNNSKKCISSRCINIWYHSVFMHQYICWTFAHGRLTKYKTKPVNRLKALYLHELKLQADMKSTKGSETKALIRKTAFKLFLSNDYSTVPLKAIESCLNLSRGCLAYHYSSKQELFVDVMDEYILKKQDVRHKMKDSDHLSLLEFIEHYINKVDHTMEHLSDLLQYNADKNQSTLDDTEKQTVDHLDINNASRAYLALGLQAGKYYDGFYEKIDIITDSDIEKWAKIIENAKASGEIRADYPTKLLAEQFRYIFLGQSYAESFKKGLDPQHLRQTLLGLYNLVKLE